jgi:hypothetical protein
MTFFCHCEARSGEAIPTKVACFAAARLAITE